MNADGAQGIFGNATCVWVLALCPDPLKKALATLIWLVRHTTNTESVQVFLAPRYQSAIWHCTAPASLISFSSLAVSPCPLSRMHFGWMCSLECRSGRVCLGLVAVGWVCQKWASGRHSIHVSQLTPYPWVVPPGSNILRKSDCCVIYHLGRWAIDVFFDCIVWSPRRTKYRCSSQLDW